MDKELAANCLGYPYDIRGADPGCDGYSRCRLIRVLRPIGAASLDDAKWFMECLGPQ